MSMWKTDFEKLEAAVLAANVEQVEQLTRNKYLKSTEHYNVLKKAIFSGQIEAARILINRDCQLYSSESLSTKSCISYYEENRGCKVSNNELLHLAIEAGSLTLVQLLIQKNISTETPDKNGIPPIFKIIDLPLDNVEYSNFLNCFLENGARIDCQCELKKFTILHYAAEKGNSTIVPLLLERNCHINTKAEGGLTPLHVAAKNGHSEVVKVLLNFDAKVTILSYDDISPLGFAIESGNLDVLKIFLQFSVNFEKKMNKFLQGADKEMLVYLAVAADNIEMVELLFSFGASVNSYLTKTGQYALHIAVEKGNIAILKLLLAHDPILNVVNKEGFTPLHLACANGQLSIVSTLLDTKKCELNATSTSDLTALHLAAREGHSEIVSLLLETGANYNVFDENNKTPIAFALENTKGGAKTLEILLNHIHKVEDVKNTFSLSQECNVFIKYFSRANQDQAGNSALHLAVQDEDVVAIKILLKHQACIYVLNKNGHTPFDLATINGSVSIVDIFLQSISNRESLFLSKEDGNTSMHLAVEKGDTDMLELFFRNGIFADISKPNALTPLHIAVQKNNKDLVLLLLRNGAIVDVSGRTDLETPLFIAAENGNAEVVQILSEASTAPSSEWREGYILLYIAAYYGHEKVVKLLLDKRVDPNFNIDKYLTPLHAAAQRGHENIVRLLLEHGAKVNPERAKHSTFLSSPILAASHASQSRILKLLIEQGANYNQRLGCLVDEEFVSEYEKILMLGSYKDSEIGKDGSLRGYSPLHFAVEAGDEATVKLLLNLGAVVNFPATNGAIAIGLAVENENEAIIKILFSAGANVLDLHRQKPFLDIENLKTNARIAEIIVKYYCSSQRTFPLGRCNMPLAIAVENQLEGCVQMLLEAQVSPNTIHNGYPLLNIAIEKGNFKIFEMILKHGVDVSATTEDSGTALMLAVKFCNENAVQLLLDAGADTRVCEHDVKSVYKGYKNTKPLDIAILNKNAKIVEMFLKKEGLDSYPEDKSPFRLALKRSSLQVVETIVSYGASINKEDENGRTPISYAVQGNNLEVVSYLLKKGAYLETMKDVKETVLHVALRHLSSCDSESIIKLLLDYGADVNIKNKKGYSPLNLLLNRLYSHATRGIDKIRNNLLNLFLSNGADTNQIDAYSGSTMLELAIDWNNSEFVRLLVLNGANIDFLNKENKTPLNTAIDKALESVSRPAFYIDLDDSNDVEHCQQPFRDVVRELTKEVARLQAATGEIFEPNRISVESKYVKKYYDRCQKELELMKLMGVCEGVSYFDLLTANLSRLASLVRNNDIKDILSLKSDVSKQFCEYGKTLLARIEIGRDRRRLLNLTHHLLKKVVHYEFSLEIVECIFSFLANRDLRNLTHWYDKEMHKF